MAKVEAEVKTRSRPAAKIRSHPAAKHPPAVRDAMQNGPAQNGPALNGAKQGARWVQQLEPQPLRWTTEEFYRMGDAGIFEGRHVELIEGVIVGLMSMGSLHAVG